MSQRKILLDAQRALLLTWILFKYGLTAAFLYMTGFQTNGMSFEKAIRFGFERMGLTYVKLGQFLAMRFDILPAELCCELNNLFEDVSPLSFEEVKIVVESELHGPLNSIFSFFNSVPIASASVAQVHEARISELKRVAVKIQRPDIERIFSADIRNLMRLAKLIDVFGFLGEFLATESVDEFANWTRRELDFTLEGHTADRLRKDALPYEVVPKIFWDFSTSKVLTMEFIEGISLSRVNTFLKNGRMDLVKEQLPNINLKEFGHHLASAVLNQYFVKGFFHGDPHPGNIIVRNDNKVAFIDFGIFGELLDDQREVLARQIESVCLGNIDEAFRCLSLQYNPTDETDMMVFEQEVKYILNRWYQTSINPFSSIEERHLGKYNGEIFDAIRRHKLQGGINTLLFWRGLCILDGSILNLHEHVELMSELRSFFIQVRSTFADHMGKMMVDWYLAFDYLKLTEEIPNYFSGFLNRLSQEEESGYFNTIDSPKNKCFQNCKVKWLSLGTMWIAFSAIAATFNQDTPLQILIAIMALLPIILFITITKNI